MKRILPILLLPMMVASSVHAEVSGEKYPSPDSAYEVRVGRTSEGPDLSITLLEGQRIVWRKHLSTNPAEEVSVWWDADSMTFSFRHVAEKESLLFAVRATKGVWTANQVTLPTAYLPQKSDTLSSIAKRYYGSKTQEGLKAILEANPWLKDIRLGHPKYKLVIPKLEKE